jgi:hypothetical protein
VASTSNTLYFYETDISSGALLFKEDQKLEKGYQIGFTPQQLFWDGDRIYMASKRAYMVMNKHDGAPLYKYEIDMKGKRQVTYNFFRHPDDGSLQGQVFSCAQPGQEGVVHRHRAREALSAASVQLRHRQGLG